MINKTISTSQMINAELIVREHNTKSKNGIKRHMPEEAIDSELIHFQCECADLECKEKIPLTLADYEKLHDSVARFVVLQDHVAPTVEKVHKRSGDITVVEKYAL